MAKKRLADENAPSLDDVVDRLDTLIAVLMPPAGDSRGAATGLAADILTLCDHEHENEDITQAVGKSSNHVKKELSLLRTKGLIKTVRRGDRQVHVRVRGA